MSKSKRDNPLTATVKRLLALSGNRCAFPGCENAIYDNEGRYIGQICHIEAANELGQRYNKKQSIEDRRGFENLMLMCYEHHIVTNDVTEYPPSKLRDIKKLHEKETNARAPFVFAEEHITKIIESQQLLAFIKDEVVEINNSLFTIKSELQDIKANSQNTVPIKVDLQSIYLQQIETYKELRKIGKYESAIFGLETYKSSNWSSFTDETKYKILVNLGIFNLDLQRKKDAGNALLDLQYLSYETKDKYALLCLGSALLQNKKEFNKWFKVAVAKDKNNVNLYLAYIQINFETSFEKIYKKIPKTLKEDADIIFSLGDVLTTQGRYVQGKMFLLKSVEKLKGDSLKIADLKGVIASKILSHLVTPYKFFFNDFTQAELQEIGEAGETLAQTWKTIKETEMAKSRYYIPMNLGSAYKVLNRMDDALFNFRLSYELSNQYLSFKNLVITYLEADKTDKAADLINEFSIDKLTIQEKMEIVLFKSQLEIITKNPGKALLLFDEFIKEQPELLQNMFTAGISSLLSKDLYNEAKSFADKYLAELERTPKVLILIGATYVSLGMIEDATKVVSELKSKVNSESAEEIINDTANLLLKIGDIKGAIPLFALILNPSIFNYPAKKLVTSHFELGEYFDAYKICLKFKEVSNDTILDEILLRIYLKIHHYPKAIEIVYKLIDGDLDERKQGILFQGLKILSVQRKWDDVSKLLGRVKNFEIFTINQAFPVAMFLMKSGNPDKAIDFMFRMRKIHYDIGDMHKLYFSFLTEIDKHSPELFKPDVVKNNFVITLRKGNNETNELTLVPENDIVEGGIVSGDLLYDLLIGKSVGDKIEYSNGIIKESLTIERIESLYYYESKKSVQLFRTKFTNQGVTVADLNSPLAEQIIMPDVSAEFQKHNIRISAVFNGYINGNLTMGKACNLFGESIVTTWENFKNSIDIGIKSFDHVEDVVVDVNQPTVIDITVLLNIFLLNGNNNLLEFITGTLYISQTTFDFINFHYEESLSGLSAAIQRNESPGVIKYLELKVEGYRQLTTWCLSKAEIKTFEMYDDIKEYFIEQGANELGECFFDSLLLAKQLNALMISDDLNFRNVLYDQFSIKSFGSISLAFYLKRENKIDIRTFESFLFKLLINNYNIIPPFGNILFNCLTASNSEIRQPFTKACFNLRAIASPLVCQTVVLFARDVFISELSNFKKASIITHVFNSLRIHSQYNLVLSQMPPLLERAFRLLPEQLDQVNHLWQISIQNRI